MRVGVLRCKLPDDVLWLIAAHGAATLVQARARGWQGRRRAGIARRQRAQEAIVMRYIESFAFGSEEACMPLVDAAYTWWAKRRLGISAAVRRLEEGSACRREGELRP